MQRLDRMGSADDVQRTGGRLNELAYAAIKKDIVEGVLKSGTFISENELATRLGISRTPIREALHRLESNRFLKIFPKRGIFIPDISVKDVQDLYSIRAVLEPFAARLATNRIELEEIKHFRKVFEKEDSIKTPLELLRVDKDFHTCIIRNSDNEHLNSLLLGFYDHLHRVRVTISDRIYAVRRRICKEHIEVIDALIERDEKRVEVKMRKHLLNAAKRMARSFVDNRLVGAGVQ